MASNQNATIYLKAEQNVELQSDNVWLKDLCSVSCTDPEVLSKVKSIPIHTFSDQKPKRVVINVLRLIEEIGKLYPNADVQSLGETAILAERINVDKHKGFVQTLKLLFVAGISFFGTAFTIMAFHNDIGISEVFIKIHEMVMGYTSKGYSILEFSYSIGLAVGIILFFNHIGGRRITKDPTPIEVEMRIYEEDVNKTLIQTSDREGKTIDVS